MSGHFLSVSHGHKIHYEVHGTPGMPRFLYLHGGPGAGYSKSSFRFFDPKRTEVLFFDQRGCGKGPPPLSTKHNTTDLLIADITALLDHLGWDKVCIFGGSWGSTLALTYAIRHPKRVTGLILRGIFLGTPESIDFYTGEMARTAFPEEYEEFIKSVPERDRARPIRFFGRMLSGTNRALVKRYATVLAQYEESIASITCPPQKKRKVTAETIAIGILEAHYLSQDCFLPPNFILKNAKKLKGIPTTIVHGRYDCVCSAADAVKLHRVIPGSKLQLVVAGHSSNDPEISMRLISETKRFAAMLLTKGGRPRSAKRRG